MSSSSSSSSYSSASAALCLACSGCVVAHAFVTPCCARPICAPCLHSNPRLARYNPCLACARRPDAANADGALRDADMFVVGDEEDEDQEDDDGELNAGSRPRPASREAADQRADPPAPPPATSAGSAPRTHRVQKGDTLRGLALRYAVDAYALCRLNGLPPSTLGTTPYLLHTRATLVLPPSSKHLEADD
ncbi:hypothetical protein M0805_000557 [Coniferiporia weirii]|nr:hypothetical protein M0805_000557 [Coniferiporia weirii]